MKKKHCDCETFKKERDEAVRRARDMQEGGEWNWMGTDEDDLESMSEGMVVRIRAGDLRGLIDKGKPPEYFTKIDVPEDMRLSVNAGSEVGLSPGGFSLTHKFINQFKVDKKALDEAESMPSMVEKIKRMSIDNHALGSIGPQPCRCDQMDGGELCKQRLAKWPGNPMLEPAGPLSVCTCDSDITDGVCRIHRRKGSRTVKE
jgi:hypothetical protein